MEKKDENQLNALEISRVDHGQEGVEAMEESSRERVQEGMADCADGHRQLQLPIVEDLTQKGN